jgi:dTDP-4-amino-4,6-dideoxygalactose transaminase
VREIPFLDLRRLHRSIEPGLSDTLAAVIASGRFIGGPAVRDFERRFAEVHGRRGAVGCASGTDALTLSLAGLGVGVGDEVIVPSMTFVATAEAVRHVGATPVLADVDEDTLLMSEADVERARTPRTRAIVPVHLYGHVVRHSTVGRWRESGLLVFEDAAQAHLATRDGRFVGEAGNAACFSFYPGKNLGALGDGGMVISDDEELLARIRQLRDHGRSGKFSHGEIGWCSRLDALQAAVLDLKLDSLALWTERRRRLADRYRDRIGGWLVPWEEGAVHHLLVARFPRRDLMRAALQAEGIETGLHYPMALSCVPALGPWRRATPCAELAADEVLSLPIDPLMPEDDVDIVCDAVQQALR